MTSGLTPIPTFYSSGDPGIWKMPCNYFAPRVAFKSRFHNEITLAPLIREVGMSSALAVTPTSEITGAADDAIFKMDTAGWVWVSHARRDVLLDEFDRSWGQRRPVCRPRGR